MVCWVLGLVCVVFVGMTCSLMGFSGLGVGRLSEAPWPRRVGQRCGSHGERMLGLRREAAVALREPLEGKRAGPAGFAQSYLVASRRSLCLGSGFRLVLGRHGEGRRGMPLNARFHRRRLRALGPKMR